MANLTRTYILISLFFFCCSFGSRVLAVQIPNLYNASVSVPSQDAVDRNPAFRVALKQLLVKLTGREDLLADGVLLEEFGKAGKYVVSFSYRENPDYIAYQESLDRLEVFNEDQAYLEPALSEFPDEALELTGQATGNEVLAEVPDNFLLDVVFAESTLKDRMRELGLPIWGRSRPSILLWLIKAEDNGDRGVIGASDIESHFPGLAEQAEVRGVPIYLPVADLTDLSVLDVDGLWGLFSDSHIEASLRYKANGVVIMRLHPLAKVNIDVEDPESALIDEWRIDWQLFMGDRIFDGDYRATSVADLSSGFVSHIAKEAASLYAVNDSFEDHKFFMLEVSDVDNFDDYIKLQGYLESLAPVSAVEMTHAQGDKLSFSVTLRDSVDKFYQHLSLARKLVKLEVEPGLFISPEDLLNEPVQKFVWQKNN